jgi:hypothetical protein
LPPPAGVSTQQCTQRHSDEDDSSSRDPLGPAGARAQLVILAGESIDLEPLLFVVGLELVFGGAPIGGLLRNHGNLSAEFFCVALQALEFDLRRWARLQKSSGHPTFFSVCGSDLRPAVTSAENRCHVTRREASDDPILRARAGSERQVDFSIHHPGFLGLAGGC